MNIIRINSKADKLLTALKFRNGKTSYTEAKFYYPNKFYEMQLFSRSKTGCPMNPSEQT